MNEKTRSTIKLASKIIVLLLIFMLVIFNYDKLKTLDIRELTVGRNLFVSALIILAVYCVKGVLFVVPAMLVYTSVGVAFSPFYAVMVNLGGILLEVTITYFLGRFLGDEYVRALLQKNKGGQKILSRKIESSFPALLVVRALPVFPIDFLSLFLGSVKSRFPVYIIASFVGISPRVVLFTLLGEGIYDYIPTAFIIKALIIILPCAAVGFIIKHLISKRKTKNQQ